MALPSIFLFHLDVAKYYYKLNKVILDIDNS